MAFEPSSTSPEAREQALFGGVNDTANRSRVDIIVTGNVDTDAVGKNVDFGKKENIS